MTPHSQEYEVMRGFLLGTLSEEDQQLMEKRLLTENGLLDELLIAEEELIDDYVNDEISAESRLKFEQHFLCTPERQQKLKFAFALGRYTSQAFEYVMSKAQEDQVTVSPTNLTWVERLKIFWASQSPVLRGATVSAAVAFVAVAVWLSIPLMFAPKAFATVTLSISSGDRAEGPSVARIKLPQDVDALKVYLKLPASSVPARGYRVELVDQDPGNPLTIAEQDAQSVVVLIPAKQLKRGEYAIHLYATNADGGEQRINGSYLFSIE